MSSPNARTRAYYRKLGYICEIVEYWSPFPKPWGKRHDLLGVFDLLLLWQGQIVGIQATTNDHVADRTAKILSSPLAKEWCECGGKILVVGWARIGARGKRKIWTMKEVELHAADFNRQEALKDSVLVVEEDTRVAKPSVVSDSSTGLGPAGGVGRSTPTGVQADQEAGT